MQQFTVPQFIDVEDKIIGPISARQFIILLAGGLFGFIFYKLFHFALFAFLTLIDAALAFIFAFAKINGMPFHFFILNVIQTARRPALRVWNNQLTSAELRRRIKEEAIKPPEEKEVYHKPLPTSKLNEISLIVDTGGVYKGEELP